MADGGQQGFAFGQPAEGCRLRPGEIVVDLFAGGGGASEALRQALGRDPDIAINHDAFAIGMHAANHPFARHLQDDIWHADPVREVGGRLVGWLHASPDCTHFSQAKGGQPRSKATRSLSWVVVKWVGTLRRAGRQPRLISLENVEQILRWGPLIAKRDPGTGRVVTLDMVTDPATGRQTNRIAAKGERVPVERQFLVPDPRRAGRTWRQFVATLEGLGYVVEWRKLVASDYGAGTSRKRLFLVARCDGEAIRWPEPTHGPGRPQPYVTAADCIDWSILCPSIFARKRPLAENTLRRIARGLKRYVIDAAEPFIVPVCNAGFGSEATSAAAPLRTITTAKGGEFAVAEPMLAAYIEQANGGPNGNPVPSHDARKPLSTIVGKGCAQRVIAAHLQHASTSNCNGGRGRVDLPLRTVMAGGQHHAVVEAVLSPEAEAGALRVAAFLVNYYGNGQPLDVREPLDTITTRDRLALVTVHLHGQPYVIVDIGLRMLTPAELYRAQGFPAGYIIDRTADGRRLTQAQAVRMVGNSVSPPPLAAIACANLDPALVPVAVAA